MSSITVYYKTEDHCAECSHSRGWHGADTNGCSFLGAGGWCQCPVIFFSDHPILPDDDDPTTCLVCRRDVDMVVVHGDGWHCPGEKSEHWPIDANDPNSECGHCGSRPSDAA